MAGDAVTPAALRALAGKGADAIAERRGSPAVLALISELVSALMRAACRIEEMEEGKANLRRRLEAAKPTGRGGAR